MTEIWRDHNRQAFLTRIQHALGRARTEAPGSPAPSVDQKIARLASAADDLPQMFIQRAIEVGMKAERFSAQDLCTHIVQKLSTYGARRVAVSMADDDGVVEALRRAQLEVVIPRTQADFDLQFEVDAGVTDVHAALAETGTLICASDAAHSRGPSLVPPVHVAVVRVTDILADMIDYLASLNGLKPYQLPSSVSFITGPSKTSDIEGVLVTGVHGPRCVEVMLVDDA